MSEEFTMSDLINRLNEATKAYDAGEPIMSDQDWDKYYFILQQAEQQTGIYMENSPTQRVVYELKTELSKVTHNHKMLSLDKTKDIDEVNTFINDKECIAMCKMDGLTCSLHYNNGKLIGAETRGNGLIGEDILHNALVIKNIPNKIAIKNELVIDGEIICDYNNFKEFQDEYKNPRNFAAGSIRLLDAAECAKRKLSFVAWDVIKGFDEYQLLSDKLTRLMPFGFTSVPFIKCNVIDNNVIDVIKTLSVHYNYPIDGVVFKFDNIAYGKSLGETEHHFKNAMAFKFYDEEYETNLIDIEWTMGRTGVLTPVAVFNPVDIEGSIVERASLHNLSVMYDTLHIPYKGQPIKVFKANMIIPQISWTDEISEGGDINYPEVCPICGKPTSIEKSDSGTENLVCTNPQCEGKFINIIDHYCSKKGLDIKGLSKKTLEKLVDWGWLNEISDLYLLESHKSEWKEQSGFGEASVSKILSAIEDSKNCELSKFLSAIGIPGIGSNASKELAKIFGNWDNFITAVKDQKYHFYDIDGFGPEADNALKTFDYTIAEKLLNYVNINTTNEEIVTNNSLEGMNICITGKLSIFKNRAELTAAIEKLGGKVTGTVSKNTNYLINNNATSASAKNLSAKKLNIPIITEENFIKNYLTF